MPMDIRSYFSASPSTKPKKQSRKRFFIDSDDSDTEPAVKTPKKEKIQNGKSPGKKSKARLNEVKPKEEISKEKVKSFFGSGPVKQIKINKVKIKKEKPADDDLILDSFDEPWDPIPEESPRKTRQATVSNTEQSSSKSPRKSSKYKSIDTKRTKSKSPHKSPSKTEKEVLTKPESPQNYNKQRPSPIKLENGAESKKSKRKKSKSPQKTPSKNQTENSLIPESPEPSSNNQINEDINKPKPSPAKLENGTKSKKSKRKKSKSPQKTPLKNQTKNSIIPQSPEPSRKNHINKHFVDTKPSLFKLENEAESKKSKRTKSKSPQKIPSIFQTEISSKPKRLKLESPETSSENQINEELKPKIKVLSFYFKKSDITPKSDTQLPEIKTSPKDSPKTELWVDKWKPTTVKQIIGQQGEKSVVNKLIFWLKNWHKNRFSGKKIARPNMWAKDDNGAFFRAALLSGPPGIGKTTSAHLVAKQLKMDIVEFNASDTRSKRLLHEEISELLSCKSLSHYAQGVSSHHVLIMDEVDGMAGNEDRGGIQELISLIKNTRVPIICMCNDRHHPKIRSLVNYCFDLKLSRPRKEQIKGAMMSICYKEGLKINPDVLNDVIENTNQDVRLILNSLSVVAAKKDASMAISAKDVKLGAWDVVRKVFSEQDQKKMTIHDKCDLFFYDYNIAPLFVHENYLNVVPHSNEGKTKIGKMKLFAQAANSLAYGDLMENAIRKNNAWSLLPTQAVFSSLIPGSVLSGHVGGKIEFPAWLGKNSKRGKMDRLSQEIQLHTRLKISGSKEAIVLDYAKCLRDTIVTPLSRGSEGIENSLSVMSEYTLLREDLESLNELCLWPGQKDPFAAVETKVKSAFTRAYNKSSIMTPFSVSFKKTKSSSIDEMDDDMDPEEEQDDNDDDIEADSMILKNKKKPQINKTKEVPDNRKPSTSKGKPSTSKATPKVKGKKK